MWMNKNIYFRQHMFDKLTDYYDIQYHCFSNGNLIDWRYLLNNKSLMKKLVRNINQKLNSILLE